MNIKQAKERFTLESLLSSLGHQPDPKKSKNNDLWYTSPFRPDERTPSFHIDTRKDIFHDFGLSERGGDLIRFVALYLKYRGQSCEIPDILEWLDNHGGPITSTFSFVKNELPYINIPKAAPYKILSVKPIFSKPLFDYLDTRKIPHKLAKNYFKQVYFQNVQNSKKTYGLGFEVRGGGYDIRNPLGFKTMIGSKDITIIKGKLQGSLREPTIDIFEGVMDFLTALYLQELVIPLRDTIVLNSTSLYDQAAEYIKAGHYSGAALWHDNDKAGASFEKAFTEAFTDQNFNISNRTGLYQGYEDLNAWHMNSELTLEEKRKIIRT